MTDDTTRHRDRSSGSRDRPLPRRDDASTAQDLRATTDSIREDLRRLAAVEADKDHLEADDPEVERLSEEAVALAGRIEVETRVERQLSEELG